MQRAGKEPLHSCDLPCSNRAKLHNRRSRRLRSCRNIQRLIVVLSSAPRQRGSLNTMRILFRALTGHVIESVEKKLSRFKIQAILFSRLPITKGTFRRGEAHSHFSAVFDDPNDAFLATFSTSRCIGRPLRGWFFFSYKPRDIQELTTLLVLPLQIDQFQRWEQREAGRLICLGLPKLTAWSGITQVGMANASLTKIIWSRVHTDILQDLRFFCASNVPHPSCFYNPHSSFQYFLNVPEFWPVQDVSLIHLNISAGVAVTGLLQGRHVWITRKQHYVHAFCIICGRRLMPYILCFGVWSRHDSDMLASCFGSQSQTHLDLRFVGLLKVNILLSPAQWSTNGCSRKLTGHPKSLLSASRQTRVHDARWGAKGFVFTCPRRMLKGQSEYPQTWLGCCERQTTCFSCIQCQEKQRLTMTTLDPNVLLTLTESMSHLGEPSFRSS